MARRKIVVAMTMRESTAFSPIPTPLASCRKRRRPLFPGERDVGPGRGA